MAKLFVDTGIITICCFITPLESQRSNIRKILKNDVHFIFVKTHLDECEKRDPKGLYERARKGEIKNFTGIDAIFEQPKDVSLEVETANKNPEECAEEIIDFLKLT